MTDLNKFTFRNDVRPARSTFPETPVNVSCYLYYDPEEIQDAMFDDNKEIQMDVCDSHYAIMPILDYYDWWHKFDEICQHEEEAGMQYMALKMSWPVKDGQFCFVIDEGWLTSAFEEFCTERGIDSQFHIDSPDCRTEHYEYIDDANDDRDPDDCWNDDEWILDNVYTGGGDDIPHLIRTLHNIQMKK